MKGLFTKPNVIVIRSSALTVLTFGQNRRRWLNRTSQESSFLSALKVSFFLLAVVLAFSAAAQSLITDASAIVGSASSLNIVRWTGDLPEAAGRTVEVSFALYQYPAGGLALWSEKQAVKVGTDGRYSVLLGATSAEGIPQTLFKSGEAQWIEVRLITASGGDAADDAVNETPTARHLLAAVPYAFKSMDAETLSGRAADDYVTREELTSSVTDQVHASLQRVTTSPVRGTLIGPGTAGYLPVWTAAATLGNSIVSDSGTSVGIGTNTPATMLDVNGASTLRGAVSLLASAATLAAGINSPALQLGASTYSSTSNAAVPQNFVWQAVSSGNNSVSPTANLALLFGSGTTTPAATGLSIAPNGVINFAPSQTFPYVSGNPGSSTGGSSSSITTVTAGSGLAGGGSSGNVKLALSAPVSTVNGGTGATTTAGALANLGALSLAGGTMTGTLGGKSASFTDTVAAGAIAVGTSVKATLICDSVTDNGPALNTMIANAATGSVLAIAAKSGATGNCNFATPLVMNNKLNFTLDGQNILLFYTGISGDAITVSGGQLDGIENLRVNGTTSSGGNGLTVSNSLRFHSRNNVFYQFKNHVMYIIGSYWFSDVNSIFDSAGSGYSDVYIGTTSNNMSFSHSRFANSNAAANVTGATVATGTSIHFSNTDVSSCNIGILALADVTIDGAPYFENNTTAVQFGTSSSSWFTGSIVSGGYFALNSSNTTGISIVKAGHIIIQNNLFAANTGTIGTTGISVTNNSLNAGALIDSTNCFYSIATDITDVGRWTTSLVYTSGNFSQSLQLRAQPSAKLMTCNASAEGMYADVTDAKAPSYLGILTGGGTVHAPVYCNGTNWITH